MKTTAQLIEEINWFDFLNKLKKILRSLFSSIQQNTSNIEELQSQSGANFTSYVALLTQENTDAPTAVEVSNTTGLDITFEYNDVGDYRIVFSDTIDMAKVFLSYPPVLTFMDNFQMTNFFQIQQSSDGNIDPSNELIIRTGSDDSTPADGRLQNTPIKIEIYS